MHRDMIGKEVLMGIVYRRFTSEDLHTPGSRAVRVRQSVNQVHFARLLADAVGNTSDTKADIPTKATGTTERRAKRKWKSSLHRSKRKHDHLPGSKRELQSLHSKLWGGSRRLLPKHRVRRKKTKDEELSDSEGGFQGETKRQRELRYEGERMRRGRGLPEVGVLADGRVGEETSGFQKYSDSVLVRADDGRMIKQESDHD